jgi:hypothetical protein
MPEPKTVKALAVSGLQSGAAGTVRDRGVWRKGVACETTPRAAGSQPDFFAIL